MKYSWLLGLQAVHQNFAFDEGRLTYLVDKLDSGLGNIDSEIERRWENDVDISEVDKSKLPDGVSNGKVINIKDHDPDVNLLDGQNASTVQQELAKYLKEAGATTTADATSNAQKGNQMLDKIQYLLNKLNPKHQPPLSNDCNQSTTLDQHTSCVVRGLTNAVPLLMTVSSSVNDLLRVVQFGENQNRGLTGIRKGIGKRRYYRTMFESLHGPQFLQLLVHVPMMTRTSVQKSVEILALTSRTPQATSQNYFGYVGSDHVAIPDPALMYEVKNRINEIRQGAPVV